MPVKYDTFYAESDRACGDPFAPFVDFVAAQTRCLRVLDLGCGQGRDALVFARAGHEVLGVDVSEVGINQLQEVARREELPLTAEVGDITTYEPSAMVDVVVLDRVLHMLQTDALRLTVLERATRTVKPGGHVLISEYPKQHDLLLGYFEGLSGWTVERDARGFFFARRSG